jgi:hypothetical protein
MCIYETTEGCPTGESLTQEVDNNNDLNFDRKLDDVTAAPRPFVK